MNYYKVYMQREVAGAEVVDTVASFGMYCMEIPFVIATSVKEPFKRDWNDEDGDDEYIPGDGLKMTAYEMDVKFGFKGDKFAANKSISDMLAYLRGGSIKLYCDYTKIGRQNVRLSKLSDNATLLRDDDGDILIITVTFKVNDPITNISLSK